MRINKKKIKRKLSCTCEQKDKQLQRSAREWKLKENGISRKRE